MPLHVATSLLNQVSSSAGRSAIFLIWVLIMEPGHGHCNTTVTPTAPSETNRHRLTDFLGKKEDVAMTDLVGQDIEAKEKHTLLEELHRTRSSKSSSSSDEEVEEGREGKKRKKKGIKDKIKEKISREEEQEQDTCTVAVENCNDDKLANEEPLNCEEEKKGFLDKIMEKLPGQHKKTEEEATTIPAAHEGEMKEKKGILDKIKEKLPGHHKNEDEPKEKQN